MMGSRAPSQNDGFLRTQGTHTSGATVSVSKKLQVNKKDIILELSHCDVYIELVYGALSSYNLNNNMK